MKLKLSAKNIDTAICILSVIVLILTCILFVRKTNSVEGFGTMEEHQKQFEKMSPEEQKKFMNMISKEHTAPGTTPTSLSDAEQLALAENIEALPEEAQRALAEKMMGVTEEKQLALAEEMMALAKEKQLALGTTPASLSEAEQLSIAEKMSALAKEEQSDPYTTPAILIEEEKQRSFETTPTPSVTPKKIPPALGAFNSTYNNSLNNASSLTIANVREQLRECISKKFISGLEETLECV